MKDDVVQLLARGAQDVWLTVDPHVSFYRTSFKRHVPFATSIERFLVPLDGRVTINPKCDLLSYVYLSAHDKTTGALVPGLDWSRIISTVDLVMGNQTVSTHDMSYINTIQSSFEAQTYSQRGSTSFQPLGFFFDTQPLPLISLRYTEVRLFLNLLTSQYSIKVWAHCIHLGEDERKYFTTTPQKMIVPLVQRVPISTEPYLRGPIKYLAAPCVNYSPIYYRYPNPFWTAVSTGTNSTNFISTIGALQTDSYVYSLSWIRNTNSNVYNSDGTFYKKITNSSTVDDSILVKYDKNTGMVVWTVQIGGSGYDDAYFIASDDQENIYFTGATNSDPMIFYSKDGTSVSLSSPPAFLVKYNSDGFVQWATRTSPGNLRGLTTEGSNVYVCGYTSGTTTAYDAPGTTSSIPSITNSSAGYLVKYNSSGVAQWMTTVTGIIDSSFGHSVSTDPTGIYYSFLASGPTITVYDAPGTSSTLSTVTVSGTDKAAVTAKFDFSGKGIFRISGKGNIQSGASISSQSYKNYFYIKYGIPALPTISLYDNLDNLVFKYTNPKGLIVSVLMKYDTSGSFAWATILSGNGQNNILIKNDTITFYVNSSTNPMIFLNSDDLSIGVSIPNDGLGSLMIAGVKYSLNGKVLGTRKITSPSIAVFRSSYNFLNIQSNNSYIRIYDPYSDKTYQTVTSPEQNTDNMCLSIGNLIF